MIHKLRASCRRLHFKFQFASWPNDSHRSLAMRCCSCNAISSASPVIGGHKDTKTKIWTSHKTRAVFLEYFKSKQHQFVKSSSVIPPKDSGTVFTNAGMNQVRSGMMAGHSEAYLYFLKLLILLY